MPTSTVPPGLGHWHKKIRDRVPFEPIGFSASQPLDLMIKNALENYTRSGTVNGSYVGKTDIDDLN